MVEFALVAPVFFFVLLASIDAGLVMFVENAASQSAAAGMIRLANEGDSASADTSAIGDVMSTGIGTTNIGKVDEIDIFHVFVCDPAAAPNWTFENPAAFCAGQPAGTIITDTVNYNRYNPVTRACIGTCPWPPGQQKRSPHLSSLSNMGIQLKYHFDYLGISAPRANLVQVRYFRLEPQQP